MNLFVEKTKSGNSSNIKQWTRDIFSLSEEAVIMVSELQCHEPDCPPIETVIAIMQTGVPQRTFKIHKPIDQIGQSELEELLTNEHRH
jgi:hypothetical protein